MAEKELEAAASGFLDTAFNLGEPGDGLSPSTSATSSSSITLRSRMGAAAFITFVHSMRSRFPEMHLDIKRVITQGEDGE